MKFPRKFYLHCRFPRQSKKAAPAPLRKHINFQPTPLPPPPSSFRISIQIPPSKTEGRGERERTEESNLGHKIFSARQKKKTFLWGEEALSLEQRRLQTTTTKIRCIFRRLCFSSSSREKTHSSSQGLRERRKRRGWVLQGAFTAFPPL